MKHWFHLDCLFESFTKQRASTKKIEAASDICGWDTLNSEIQGRLLQKIKQSGGSGEVPAARDEVRQGNFQFKTSSL